MQERKGAHVWHMEIGCHWFADDQKRKGASKIYMENIRIERSARRHLQIKGMHAARYLIRLSACFYQVINCSKHMLEFLCVIKKEKVKLAAGRQIIVA